MSKPIHFDDSQVVWAVGATVGAFDIESLALHEIGHIVGLDHSTVPGSLMLAAPVSSNAVLRMLQPDDVAGYLSLYAKVPRVTDESPTKARQLIGAARLTPRIYSLRGALIEHQTPAAGTIVAPGSIVVAKADFERP